MIILIFSIALTMLLPKPEMKSFAISDKIPSLVPGWQSQDISQDLKEKNGAGNLVGEIFARVYYDRSGRSLVFMVLDAGNFHNPKVCYGGAGYDSQELGDTVFTIDGQPVKAQTVLLRNGDSSRLLMYWLCVNKRIVGWGEQKVLELFNSVFNQNKTRFMVRFEIPTEEDNIEESIELVESFVQDVYSNVPQQYAEYVFGRLK